MVDKATRELVKKRADDCCEYCRMRAIDRLIPFQIDHILAIKHDGTDDPDNLCLACFKCNTYKGANVAAIDPKTNQATRLFHPRQQKWDEHFRLLNNAQIVGITPEGRVTIFVLKMNDATRIEQRLSLMDTGRYPCEI